MTQTIQGRALMVGDDWLSEFLEVVHLYYCRAMAFSPRLHMNNSTRQVMFSEYINDYADNFDRLISNVEVEGLSNTRYSHLQNLHWETEDLIGHANIWFDSLTHSHGCTNEVIDHADFSVSGAVTYPKMKRALLSGGVKNTCIDCLSNRHQIERRDGLEAVVSNHRYADCLIRPTLFARNCGIGFRLTIAKYARFSMKHTRDIGVSNNGHMRIEEIALTPSLRAIIEKSHPWLLDGHRISTGNIESGDFIINHSWEMDLHASVNSVREGWQRSGLGRKEGMFGKDSSGALKKAAVIQGILTDIGNLREIVEKSWVPTNYRRLNDIYVARQNFESTSKWPIYRVWCNSDILRILKSDTEESLPRRTPIFTSSNDMLKRDDNFQMIVLELDNLLIWR